MSYLYIGIVFQSTPLHEGRLRSHGPMRRMRSFNPRPYMRGDNVRYFSPSKSHLFQSTPLHEGRRPMTPESRTAYVFQSTPLHEGRHPETALYNRYASFNPRPYMRGDSSPHVRRVAPWLFQSTPLHEGRQEGQRLAIKVNRVSIHAPT